MSSNNPEAAPQRPKDAQPTAGTNDPRKSEGKKLSSRGPSAKRGEIKEKILVAAHEEFVEKGYDPTTMSAIAKRAGCTSAMITYYFESKQRLFRASFNLPLDPAETILEHLSEGREGAGDRIARRAFQFYEEGTSVETLRVLMQTLMTDAGTSQRFRDYIRNDVIGEVGAKLGITTELAEEVEIAMAATFGVITMRYIVRLEPLASMPKERLIRELGAILQIRIDRAFARLERSQER